MELSAQPWAGIDPDLMISGQLSLSDLERYWTTPMGQSGSKDACCNCGRVLPIMLHGLCRDCVGAAGRKVGSDLLNALTLCRARYVAVAPVPHGKIGQGSPENFERPKVVGRVPVAQPMEQPVVPAEQEAQPAEPPDAPVGGLRVEGEDGADLGPLAEYMAARDAEAAQQSAEDECDTPIRQQPRTIGPIKPVAKRALVIEYGDAEIQFRIADGRVDVRCEDGGDLIFLAREIDLQFFAGFFHE